MSKRKTPRTPKEPRTRKNTHRTFDEIVAFGKIWNKSESTAKAAEASGMTPIQASQLATRLRKAGGKLKKMPRSGRTAIDIKAFNSAL